jgi:hypothetical protein
LPAGIKREVVKASQGHYPLPFLISDVKNWNKDKRDSFLKQKNFFK